MTSNPLPPGTKLVPIKVKGIVHGAFGNGTECTGIIEDILYPPEGGTFTKYMGCNYLFKGYPDTNVVQAIATPKKMVALAIRTIKNKGLLIITIPATVTFIIVPKFLKKKIVLAIANYFLNISSTSLRKVFLPYERYCVSAKAVWDAMEVANKKIKDKDFVICLNMLKEILCMIIEHDYSYKARWQDTFQYFNKRLFLENPTKEILRIMEILIERENTSMDETKWRPIIMAIRMAMMSGDIKKYMIEFFKALDINRITPDDADWYFMLDRLDYNYGGLTLEERLKISKEMDLKVGNKRPQVIFQEGSPSGETT